MTALSNSIGFKKKEEDEKKKTLPGSFNEEADFKGSPLPRDLKSDDKCDNNDNDEVFPA